MDDYISRQAAIKTAWMILEGLGFSKRKNPGLETTVVSVYASAPAADLVEVVRCKDCRYYTAKHGRLPWNTTNRYCNRSATVATAPENFCSFGEKTADKQCLPLRREKGETP